MTRLLVIGVQVYGVDARRAAAASRFVRLREGHELSKRGRGWPEYVKPMAGHLGVAVLMRTIERIFQSRTPGHSTRRRSIAVTLSAAA
jgi:hypothetical protein